MRSSCITYPDNEPIVLIKASQVQICDGNHCAAALLSYFEYWHNIRLQQTKQAEHANKVSALHGEPGTQDTTLLQYHTEDDIEEGLLHLYGRKTIRAGIALLVRKQFLSLHDNPNARYRFDRTHYFLLHPKTVQEHISAVSHQVKMPHPNLQDVIDSKSDENHIVTHEVKIHDRQGDSAASSGKNASWSGKNASWSGKNTSPIAEITSEITDREKEENLLCPPPQKTDAPPSPEEAPLTPEILMELYNATIPPGHPRIDVLSNARRKKAKEYIQQFPDRCFWEQVFGEIAKSPMLQGKRPNPGHEKFVAGFDWFFQKGSKDQIENCVKTHEGRYRERAVAHQKHHVML
jgi:hypothetical protein